MPLLAAGHKRTGACPTFDRPVLQRDGYLVRVPLVGGALTAAQAGTVAQVSEAYGNGIIELTNRGNLQVRGVREDALTGVLGALREVGLGHPDAALVTISPFASPAENGLRDALLVALDRALADGAPPAPKFTVHVDDADGRTAQRRAEAVLTPMGDAWRIRVAGLGEQHAAAPAAIAFVVALAEACRTQGSQARVADLIAAWGAEETRRSLPLPAGSWTPIAPVATSLSGPLGASTGSDGTGIVFAAARLGRIDPATLVGVADLLDRMPGAALRVTPWRSFALTIGAQAAADEVVRGLAALGLIIEADDPAANVVACIGAAGCWQTEVDTLAEAERQIARRSTGAAALHVTGCDKRCATRSPVALTLVGRPDGSGFDEVAAS